MRQHLQAIPAGLKCSVWASRTPDLHSSKCFSAQVKAAQVCRKDANHALNVCSPIPFLEAQLTWHKSRPFHTCVDFPSGSVEPSWWEPPLPRQEAGRPWALNRWAHLPPRQRSAAFKIKFQFVCSWFYNKCQWKPTHRIYMNVVMRCWVWTCISLLLTSETHSLVKSIISEGLQMDAAV